MAVTHRRSEKGKRRKSLADHPLVFQRRCKSLASWLNEVDEDLSWFAEFAEVDQVEPGDRRRMREIFSILSAAAFAAACNWGAETPEARAAMKKLIAGTGGQQA